MKLGANTIYRISSMIVVVSFTQFALISNSAKASIVDSRMILSKGGTSHARENNEKKVRRLLENKIIAKRLESYGLSDEKVFSKIEAMSDEQVHQLASLSDRMPAGGDAGAAVVIVIVTIAVAIILLLVLLTLSKKG
ncbi:MAG: PA2779 family protein [Thermodesulfobacteriota bacterium]